MNRDEIILKQLVKAGAKGLTGYDFPKIIHYKDAIMNLRNRGYDIVMIMEQDELIDRQIGRYFYKGYTGKIETPKEKKETKRNQAIKLALEGMNSDNKEVRLFASRVYNLLK